MVEEDRSPIGGEPAGFLHETIIRFPSAPIFHTHRKPDYQQSLDRVNFHTFRLLRRPFTDTPSPIRRIYLIHNGLNERDNLGTYYRIAHLLFKSEEARLGLAAAESACLVRPIPGHLTRYPFPGDFAEKPMDRYLADAGDLFRQFLRFMLETQWLLSILVPHRDYRTYVGLNLLAQGSANELGRLDSHRIARSIWEEWSATHAQSAKAYQTHQTSGRDPGPQIEVESVHDSVLLTRWLLGWKGSQVWSEPPSEIGDPPAIHTVGYSLGGFLAQSAFFTWPQAISTCTLLNSGGPLEDVQLSGFAHFEEWQRVLHSLRYELDTAMLTQAIKLEGDSIAGTQKKYFSSFLRTFYEVFLQDYQGQYRSRVSEFVQRLLFVVGGRDPVVSPEAVMRQGPDGGINLIEVANLSHALHEKSPDWRLFWLPQVAGVIDLFARRGENLLAKTLQDFWQDPQGEPAAYSKWRKVSPSARTLEVPAEGEAQDSRFLASEAIDDQLDQMVSQLSLSRSWMIVARNQIPEELLGEQFLEDAGITMHHEESRVALWNYRRIDRGLRLLAHAFRVVLIIPRSARIDATEEPPIVSVHPEATAGRFITSKGREHLYDEFAKRWTAQEHSQLFLFEPTATTIKRSDQDLREILDRLNSAARQRVSFAEDQPVPVNTLPDVWISIHERLARRWVGPLDERSSAGDFRLRPALIREFVRWASHFAGQKSVQPEMNALTEFLKEEDLKILKVSRGEFNPRFRGYRVHDPREASRLIVHTALAYSRSELFR